MTDIARGGSPMASPEVSRKASQHAPRLRGNALWEMGFRPFYLLASGFAALSVLLWVGQYAGWLSGAYLRGSAWHGHEMLFGFTTAVIAGFLLTAVRNWTGRSTISGAPLMLLAALWVCGRILVLTPLAVAAAVANIAFPVAVACAIAIPLWQSRNVRNYFFVALLLLMGACVGVVHLALAGRIDMAPQAGLLLARDTILLILAVIAGRVVPMFTSNGVPGARATRHAGVEKAALGLIVLLFVADLLQWDARAVSGIALLAALAHAVRLALWQPWRTLRAPLVWILHAGYAWIVVHLLLRALAGFLVVPETLATHALTVGAIGAMTLGMMTRTARGHTGRLLAADRVELSAFLMVQLAAVIRVGGGLLLPQAYTGAVEASGLLWAAAFGVYAIRYWPVLSQPRVDGRPG